MDSSPRYRVVSYGSFQTGDTDGLLEHGQFEDPKEAVRMAQVVVESSLRQDAAASNSSDELGKRYWDFGTIPVIWGDPRPEFDPYTYANQVAPLIWSEYMGRVSRYDTQSREVQWEQARARRDKVLLMRAAALAAGKHRDQRRKDAEAELVEMSKGTGKEMKLYDLAKLAGMEDWYLTIYTLLSFAAHAKVSDLDRHVVLDEHGTPVAFQNAPDTSDQAAVWAWSTEVQLAAMRSVSALFALDCKVIDSLSQSLRELDDEPDGESARA